MAIVVPEPASSDGAPRHFRIEAEPVGGDVGPGTEIDRSGTFPCPTRLEFEFDGWLGGCLLEGCWTYLATRTAADRLTRAGMTGFQVRPVVVRRGPDFEEMNPGLHLPEFIWLDVDGVPGMDDFGMDDSRLLVVSGAAFQILDDEGLGRASSEPWPKTPSVVSQSDLDALKQRLLARRTGQ